MGIAPSSHKVASPFALYVAKVTGVEPVGDATEMLMGHHLEPVAADLLARARPELNVYPGGLYASVDRPYQMATFDRLGVDRSGPSAGFTGDPFYLPPGVAMPVQIKTAATRRPGDDPDYWWGEPGSNTVPVHIRAQALWETDIAGSDAAIVPCLFRDDGRFSVYVIDRDADTEADLEAMRAEALAFITRVQDQDAPPIDGSPSTTGALKTLYGGVEEREVVLPKRLARRYKAAKRAKKVAEARLGKATNEVLAALGTAKWGVVLDDPEGQPVKVVTRSRFPQGSTDVDALSARFPEAYAATRRSTDVDKLSPGSWVRA
jgi:hypothetical protein